MESLEGKKWAIAHATETNRKARQREQPAPNQGIRLYRIERPATTRFKGAKAAVKSLRTSLRLPSPIRFRDA
jgi:hypothetical protein